MITRGFDVEASFHKTVRAKLLVVQNAINTALGTSYTIAYYPQRNAETFPSVRSWFFQSGGISKGRHAFVSRVQIDIYVKSDDPTKENRQLLTLIRDNLAHELGITTQRSAFHAYFNASGYFANALTPPDRGMARLELANPGGWRDVPQGDPYVRCLSLDFNIFYR